MAARDPEAPLGAEGEDDVVRGGRSEAASESSERLWRTSKLTMAESVYSYIVLYPEVNRVRKGTYLSGKVFIAFAMIALNLTAQISLTLITGESILEDGQSYKQALLGRTESTVHTAEEEKEGAAKAAGASDEAEEKPSITKRLQDTVAKGAGNATTIATDAAKKVLGHKIEKEECCVGVYCAGNRACCMPSAAGVPRNSTNLLKLGKPSGSGKGSREPSNPKKAQQEGEDIDERPKRALCNTRGAGPNSLLDCSPPTFAFMGVWEHLDTDKDGVWSRKEAHADEANLGCRLAMDPAIVFSAVLRGTRKYAEKFRGGNVSSSITTRQGVSKSYFDHWVGTLALCSAVDPDRCPELIESGVYNGALKAAVSGPGMAIDSVTSLNEALDHCQTMLQDGGVCEKALPVTYKIYRQQVRSKCGAPSLTTGQMFLNPFDEEDVMRSVHVDYENLEMYIMANGFTFQFFVSIILLIWYLALLGEAIALCNMADFIWNFPACDDADPLHIRRMSRKLKTGASKAFKSVSSRLRAEEAEEAVPFGERAVSKERQLSPRVDPESCHIPDICTEHRMLCTFILIVRTWLMVYMAVVGTIFLQNTYSYPDLLMNAVALAFVFELPEFLYHLLVSQEDKDILNSMGDLEFKTSVPEPEGVWSYILEINFYGLFIFPVLCVITCACHFYYTVQPVYEALDCVCLQSGDRCRAGQVLTESWWSAQWGLPMPTS
jgi:hypothetical protein